MKKKILVAVMAMAMVATTVTPQIFATADEKTQIVTENKSAATEVKYSQTSTFSVTVPKTITLGADKTSSYTVDVNGDIASNENVTVTPDATVTMKDVNSIKADVTGTITQDKTSWIYSEMDTDATGSISATGLTAGTWNGTFNFAIALNTVQ